jgi:hypothetical protein
MTHLRRFPGVFITTALLVAATISLTSCGRDRERPEKIDKLRAIGVISEPAVVAPGQAFTLTFYAALPPGQTATVTPQKDENARYSLPLEIAMIAGSETYEPRAAFQLFSVRATTMAPPLTALSTIPAKVWRIRYRLRMNAGDQEEVIVGDVLAARPDAPELAWQPPTLEIIKPQPGGKVGDDIDLEAKLSKTIDEPTKIGWFVSSGEVKNRRASSTKWEDIDSGPQTLIVTARGSKSRAFAFKVVDVNTP